jgi:hypothetical protein
LIFWRNLSTYIYSLLYICIYVNFGRFFKESATTREHPLFFFLSGNLFLFWRNCGRILTWYSLICCIAKLYSNMCICFTRIIVFRIFSVLKQVIWSLELKPYWKVQISQRVTVFNGHFMKIGWFESMLLGCPLKLIMRWHTCSWSELFLNNSSRFIGWLVFNSDLVSLIDNVFVSCHSSLEQPDMKSY